ncbi:MAG: diacylglycerol kinase [Gammaproteobacteria bacterium]|nr:diacylglycerol kinase [Gammaproteobacteria bacterium]NNF60065.1 diacylglycerol kinase [Gammaproteobacteria bacterium]NNM21144.1 diacylglycerol kinase [Gammaproteobacteria bacterium]
MRLPERQRQTGLTHLIKATGYSLSGLKAAFTHEAAFRQELALGVVFFPLAFFVGQTAVEVAVLLLSLFIVLIVELINSALETLTDRVGTERHELSGRAKDLGSAAVMIALLQVWAVWGVILFY